MFFTIYLDNFDPETVCFRMKYWQHQWYPFHVSDDHMLIKVRFQWTNGWSRQESKLGFNKHILADSANAIAHQSLVSITYIILGQCLHILVQRDDPSMP